MMIFMEKPGLNAEDSAMKEFIENRIRELKFVKKQELFKAMGYVNVQKANRRLNELLQSHTAPEDFLEKLAQALKLDVMDIRAFIDDFKKIESIRLSMRQRVYFRPHICAMCEHKRPQSILSAMGSNSLRFEYFDWEINQKSMEEALEIVAESVKINYLKNEGKITSFGKILYYIFYRHYGESVESLIFLDIEGRRIGYTESMQTDPGHFPGISIR
jgi:hypothetical protein